MLLTDPIKPTNMAKESALMVASVRMECKSRWIPNSPVFSTTLGPRSGSLSEI